jgi:hypothetical protein
MISAPSHRPLLNGNRLLTLLFVGLLVSSCALFQKAEPEEDPEETGEELDALPGRKVYDPETGTLVVVEETPTETMDTIKWKLIPRDSIPPIESGNGMAQEEQTVGNPIELIERGDYGTEYYTSYNVVLMLPFLGPRFNPDAPQIYDNSYWALNYYGGVKMALDELENRPDVKLNVTVMDSEASTRRVGNLLNSRSELFNAHLIIGNYRSDNADLVAQFARRNGITYVSPHTASAKVGESNPNYVQVSPSLRTHCEVITQHAYETYGRRNIVLVSRDKPAETARFNYFQEENFRLEGSSADSVLLREYIVKETDDFSNIDLSPYIRPGDTTAFIVPSWSSETFIYALLSQAKLAKGMDSHVVFYGMPQWQQYDRIDLNLYEDLNVHISSDTYLDPYDTDIKFFQRRFFERYGLPPGKEAYLGYDVMRYFGEMIQKHGTKFQYRLDQEPSSLLHTRFQFDRVVEPIKGRTENLPIERFENKFVNILKFQDYQFQSVN